MIGTEFRGNPASVRQLVIQRSATGAGITDGIGSHRLFTDPVHVRNDETGIDTAGEESADGHVADHLGFDARSQCRINPLDPVSFGQVMSSRKRQGPVLLFGHPAVFDNGDMPPVAACGYR